MDVETNSEKWLYSTSPLAVAEMLEGGGEFNPPTRIVSGLTEAQATTLVPAAPHCIAQILAHMHFYQNATLARARSEVAPKPAHLEDTFALPPSGTWDRLVGNFLADIETCKALAKAESGTTSPDRDDTSLTYDLAESALHNAYHLGQIVMLRQMQGTWPPPDGDPDDF